MKKFLIVIMLIFGTGVMAANICPAPDEVRIKMKYFQDKAIEGMSAETSNYAYMNELSIEQKKYIENLYSGCLSYLKSEQKPDCKRITTFMTGYMLLPEEKVKESQLQIQNLSERLKLSCPNEVQSLMIFLK